MKIQRPFYLNQMIRAKGNGFIKIITGIRRCGKSYLLKTLFREHLRESGVVASHIIFIDLEDRRNAAYCDPDYFLAKIDERMTEDGVYYILIDEVQKIKDFVEVLGSLLVTPNADVFVTGSNSRFLSKDVITDFRGRSDEIHMYPLSFAEFCSAYNGDEIRAWNEYVIFGGLPHLNSLEGADKKSRYLKSVYETVHLKDIYERHHIENPVEFEELTKTLASSIGSSINPSKIADTIESLKHLKSITDKTISSYMGYIEDAFLIEKSEKYDIKGRRYIGSPSKYYFQDIGLRNAILSFRQQDDGHIMENIIYNELRMRGFSVDVGNVPIRVKDDSGSYRRATVEVDFVANRGSERYYIQSAWRMPDAAKVEQESRSLQTIKDSFKKIIVVSDPILIRRDNSGITTMSIYDFLLREDSLNL